MSDWLDVCDFHEYLKLCLFSDRSLDHDSVAFFKAAIRSHFIPKRQWTKITDDPVSWPDFDKHVILDTGNDLIMGFRWGDADPGLEWQSTDYKTLEPIAWMPLPEPYRGENGQD